MIFKTFATMILGVLTIIACSDEDIKNDGINHLKRTTNSFDSLEELYNLSKKHSEGLEMSLISFFEENKEDFIHSNQIDTLSVIKYFQTQSKSFLTKNPILYKGEFIDNEYLIFPDDSFMLSSIRDLENPNFNGNETVRFYYDKIKTILETHLEDSTAYKENLDELFFMSQNEIGNETDKIVVQLMIGVAYDSYTFWKNYTERGGNVNYKKKINGTTILADIYGAGEWGLFGLGAAGPLGAVIVGINGAIINSGVTHALSKILD